MACCSCCSKKVAGGIFLGLGSLLLVLGCVLGFAVFPHIIKELVAENVLLKKGSQSWDLWKKLPIPMKFQVYFFNVTNIDGIYKGEMPIVQEIGPYVYNEYKEKYDIVVDEISGTAAYYQNTTLTFDPISSGELDETDNVTILNPAMMGIMDLAGNIFNGPSWYTIFNGNGVFLTSSVKKILFDGVNVLHSNPLALLVCSIIGGKNLPTLWMNPDKTCSFALFKYKNNANDGRYEVKLGWDVTGPYPSVKGAQLLGKIVRWQNSTTLDKWPGKECNKITGTDATIFPPYLTEDSRIDIFSTDLCRSLTALYESDTNYKGIDALRFTAHEMLLADVNTNPDNYCYCPPQNGCLLKGALDLTPCQEAPVIITFPHFYMADEKYLKMVSGLNPSKDLHQTFLDIEPNTGIPLRGGKKVQFNMQLKPMSLNLTENVTNSLFPIAWINEGVELDDKDVNKLKTLLVNNLKIVSGLTWGLIGIGIAMIVIGLCLLLWVKFKGDSSKRSFST